MFEISDDEYLAHYGTPRHSGRYPWGSGEHPEERNKSLLKNIDDLKKKGLSEAEIAKGLGITDAQGKPSTTKLRAMKSIAKNAQRTESQQTATKLKSKGMSNVAIGKQMGIPESSVRALLDPSAKERTDVLKSTADMLKSEVDKKGAIDIGAGVENHIGVSKEKLNTAVAMLQEQGYKVQYVKTEQLGTGKYTTVKALVPADKSYSDLYKNPDQIKTINSYTENGGRSYLGLEGPKQVDSSRISVKYGSEGGAEKDGVIELRRGVDDISLKGANYAQVRVAVDGTHYLKGMAMYADDLPEGTDIRFNTNKENTGNKLDALKKQKSDEDNPFGAVVRQSHYTDAEGKQQLSALNIVNEEGDWGKWSRSLSSQMLSKQSPALAKKQLDQTFAVRKDQLDEIKSLTNPAVKKKLLETFADSTDSAAVHMKAAALPRQRTHVILPIDTMKENEIYAPNYNNGEKVVLVRYPHGGKFEIPELTVNNKQSDARRLLGNAVDAVGIHSSVASRLSGADFDGDTVLVIPNNDRKVKTEPALAGLKNFDPQMYKNPEGVSPISSRTKQLKMGDVSNLITDMTIKGATNSEIARAVRHSMVVIDAEKHNLDIKRSAEVNGIAELKKKYQGSSKSGASTIISKASSTERVPERKAWNAARSGSIDPATGKKIYQETGASYTDQHGKTIVKTTKSTKLAEADDAHELSSGTPMEAVYADHANRLKSLANDARKEYVTTKTIPYSASAKKAYDPQVKSLNAKLNVALKNAPMERQAQLLANSVVKSKLEANPSLESADVKKIKGQALTEARSRVGAKKEVIQIEPDEWKAIQAGAITNNKLTQILNNADLDQVKQLATPRVDKVMPTAKVNLAKSMLANGYTQAEVAESLGVPVSTLTSAIARGDDGS